MACKCCCGECHYSLTCDDCCGCVPKQICVSVVGVGTDCSCLSKAFSVADFDCSTRTWDGTVICGDLTFDFSVYIEADQYGDCYLYLDSDCLSSTLSDALRAPLSDPTDPYGATCRKISSSWTGVSHTCGDTDCTSLTITVAAADRLQVPPEGCATDCLDCTCVCKTLCITYSSDDCVETVEDEGELVDGVPTWTYSFDCDGATVSGTITLECYNGEMSLVLDSSDGDGGAYPQENCPDLLASWLIDAETSLIVRCKECGECDTEVDGCCDIALDCPDPVTVNFCDCEVTIPETSGGACWEWSGSPSCNGETWNINFQCTGEGGTDGQYRLAIGCDAMSPDQVVAYATAVSCDPFVVAFEVDMGSYTGDCTECDGVFDVVVTE